MLDHPRRRAGRAFTPLTPLTSLTLIAVAATALVGGSGLPAPAAASTGSASTGSASTGSASTGSASTGSASTASPATGGSARPLLLVTGDRLLVTSAAGRQNIAVRTASRDEALTGLRFGGQVMEIPAEALPYLGRGLSPSLFEVSALEQAGSGARLPVRVTFAGRRPAIPGLTVTRSGAGFAAGYLTASSARTFGAALERQYRADHSSGQFGNDGIFRHSVNISLAGAAPVAGPIPAFRMHTLTVDGTNLAGRPDTGDDVFITSADNVTRFDGIQETDNFFYRGAAKFSLPAGHYWAIATFLRLNGNGGSLRMVVLPQFTVTGRHTTVHIAERSATSEVTMPTPQPAVSQQTSFEVVRGARHGSPFSYAESWSGLSGWVSPTTRRPTVGTLQSFTSATLTSPGRVTPVYAYNLDFPGPAGTIPGQHFEVQPADLATVTENYYQDVPTANGGWTDFGGTPAQLAFEFSTVLPIAMPQQQTQYFSAGPGLLWANETFTNQDQFSGGDIDDFRSYSPGEQQTQDWNNFPLHPAPNTTLGGAAAAFPTEVSQFRLGDGLWLNLTPFSDNQFGHLGAGFFGNGNAPVRGSYEIDQNGTDIAHGNALGGIPPVNLSAKPSVIRFVLDASRSSSFFRLSPTSQTIWTWRSARDTTARVPAAWFCLLELVHNQIRPLRQCAVQPLMTLNYNVEGLSLSGLTPAGDQAIDLTVGHVQLGGTAAVTGATAEVSYNNGGSWQPATVTAQGDGSFRVAYSAPGGVDVTLRVSATDSAGGSIRETILRAYGVSP